MPSLDAGPRKPPFCALVTKEMRSAARRGAARTFQTLRLFLNMSVIENVMASQYGQTKVGFVRAMLRTPGMRREEREIRALREAKFRQFEEWQRQQEQLLQENKKDEPPRRLV